MQLKEVLSSEIVDGPLRGSGLLLPSMEEKDHTLGNDALAQLSPCKLKNNTAEFYFIFPYGKALKFKMT